MATDPTKRIVEQRYDSALAADLDATIRRMAALEPSTDIPTLTVSLDWRIEGTNPGRQPDERTRPELTESNRDGSKQPQVDEGVQSARRRPSYRWVVEQLEDVVGGHGPRGDIYDSLSADAERIRSYLESEIDPEAHGVYFAANSSKGLFEVAPLALPLPNRVRTGAIPALSELVRLDEDYPRYAVLQADQDEALLSIIARDVAERGVEFEGNDYPRKQSQGGWSQRRFQARADERIEAFARDVAEETREELERADIDMLVIAAGEVVASALDDAFHESVKERIIGNVSLDIRTSLPDVIDATRSVAEKAEREREQEAVRQVGDGVGAGTYGAGGVSDVLTALQAGQVETLVMVDDFSGTGWADYTMPAFGNGEVPSNHPLGGDVKNLVAVDLREEMIRLAIQADADVEIVHTSITDDQESFETVPQAGGDLPRSDAAVALDAHGGVGAILRYVIGDEPSEEESAAQAQDRNRL